MFTVVLDLCAYKNTILPVYILTCFHFPFLRMRYVAKGYVHSAITMAMNTPVGPAHRKTLKMEKAATD
jgi:hypothetical protein